MAQYMKRKSDSWSGMPGSGSVWCGHGASVVPAHVLFLSPPKVTIAERPRLAKVSFDSPTGSASVRSRRSPYHDSMATGTDSTEAPRRASEAVLCGKWSDMQPHY